MRVKSRISTLDNAIDFREIERYYMRENVNMLQQHISNKHNMIYPPTYEQATTTTTSIQQQQEDDVEFEDALQ